VKKRITPALLLVVLTLGCSPSLAPLALSDLNAQIEGKSGTVVLSDGRSFDARHIVVTPDSTHWIVPKAAPWSPHKSESIPTSQVAEITIPRRGKGALRGLGYGVVVGALAGFAWGGSGDLGSIAASILVPVGALLGTITGFGTGADRYPVSSATGFPKGEEAGVTEMEQRGRDHAALG